MIVLTGAAGFIGSCMLSYLNENGYEDIVLVDDFSAQEKEKNLSGKTYSSKVHRKDLLSWLSSNHKLVQIVIHLGARTDTAEFDTALLNRLNLDYTKNVWNACVEYGLPLIYASSAATYGNGEYGYTESNEIIEKLEPLNPYGISKNEFDKWAIKQEKQPYFWAGLKFFNVYGPNEYHKNRMASVIFHAFNQIKESGKVKLFRSHNPNFEDGEQLRDFVYVKDVVSVILFLLENRHHSGIYNLGSGTARSFLDLVKNTYAALDKAADIEFIDIPADIREKYQYFTEANMEKLKSIGYTKDFYTLEKGIKDYVSNYLLQQKVY